MPISINGTTASVTGLTNGTSYRFRVAARNAVGLGPYTAATTPGTPSGPPDPPPADPPGTTWTKIEYTPSPPTKDNDGVFDAVPAGTRLYDKGRSTGLYGVSSSAQAMAVLADILGRMAPRYSTNGTSWTQTQGLPPLGYSYGQNGLYSGYGAWIPGTVLYGLARPVGGATYDTYVAVGDISSFARSIAGIDNQFWDLAWSIVWAWATDGASWTPVYDVDSNSPAAAGVDTACYDGWRFTASSSRHNAMFHSADGITWERQNDVYLAALCGSLAFYKRKDPSTGSFGNTYVAGVPESAATVPATRFATNLPLTARPVYGAAPAGSIRYVATTSTGTYYTSIIGADNTGDPLWTERTLPAGFTPAPFASFSSPVAYGNGHWLMLARSSGSSTWRTLLRSTDAISWTPMSTLPVSAAWSNIFFFDNYFYAAGSGLWRSQ